MLTRQSLAACSDYFRIGSDATFALLFTNILLPPQGSQCLMIPLPLPIASLSFPSFQAMFSLCMVESGADEVNLRGVTSLGLKQALEFAYTGQ
ncbi:hypothetical protein STEG23_027431, partial [Scotinomys teguina]